MLIAILTKATYIFDLSENYKLVRKIILRPIDNADNRRNLSPNHFLLHGNHLSMSSLWKEDIYGYKFELGS